MVLVAPAYILVLAETAYPAYEGSSPAVLGIASVASLYTALAPPVLVEPAYPEYEGSGLRVLGIVSVAGWSTPPVLAIVPVPPVPPANTPAFAGATTLPPPGCFWAAKMKAPLGDMPPNCS